MILIGFMIFRWAVIAAPILGTIGLLRPANAGLRRLGNVVIAALFNIVIFGAGSAVYLFAVSLILGTASLAPWLQMVLIWLTGVVGWLLLRPYRRIAQLGGKDSTGSILSIGNWHRLFMRDVRTAAALKVLKDGESDAPRNQRGNSDLRTSQRPESRTDDTVSTGGPQLPAERPETGESGGARSGEPPTRRRRTNSTWEEPDVPAENASSYSIYRPGSDRAGADRPVADRTPVRRRPESANLPG
jgi:hypothetical protein